SVTMSPVPLSCPQLCSSFFSRAPAPPELYPLSLHDALPIYEGRGAARPRRLGAVAGVVARRAVHRFGEPQSGAAAVERAHEPPRSEEHTSELQSLTNLVCRLLLEKKKRAHTTRDHQTGH